MQNSDIIKTLENAAMGPANPFVLFGEWLTEAEKTEPDDPNAMCLATADATGQPNARILLLKDYDERGFVFYTNKQSRKGGELSENPRAALCFHWKSLDRQIRIQGRIEPLSDTDNDAYFATRPRGSRLGAWASQQSRVLDSRSTLAARVKEFDQKFGDTETIPRPPHWGGYRLVPQRIEFWHEGADRLHTRLLYTNTDSGWNKTMLYP